jgi:uncharacterized protein (UPF0264 family)
VSSARERGLLVAVAGKVAAKGIPTVAGSGADIVGVRGAVCDEGRNGHVSLARVRLLRDLVDGAAPDEPGDRLSKSLRAFARRSH